MVVSTAGLSGDEWVGPRAIACSPRYYRHQSAEWVFHWAGPLVARWAFVWAVERVVSTVVSMADWLVEAWDDKSAV